MTTSVSSEGQCPFCDAKASIRAWPERMANIYTCKICGDFCVADHPGTDYVLQSQNFPKRKLAAMIKEWNIRNNPKPILFLAHDCQEEIIDNGRCIIKPIIEILNNYPKTGIDVFDRILQSLNILLAGNPLSTYTITDIKETTLFYILGKDSKDISRALVPLLDEMQNLGYIKSNLPMLLKSRDHTGKINQIIEVGIAANGWKRLTELEKSRPGGISQVFVAMWFHGDRTIFYEEGIKPAIETAFSPDYQIRALRIDHSEHNDKICDKIISEIKRSRFLVVDVTGNNAGAYYEAGFAQGLGMPIIWLIENRYFREHGMHFDVRQYNTVMYESPEDLREKLELRIKATIPVSLIMG